MKKTLLALLALLCTPFALRADTLYVTPTGAGNQDGSSWANAFAGIQAAVDAADAAYAADGTLHDILVADGTYSRVSITNDLALDVRSVNGAASTIIDGYNTNNCVDVRLSGYTNFGQSPTFTGFTLRNGNVRGLTYDRGGGAGGGTLVDCVIEDCQAWMGGGTYQANTMRCVIHRCSAPTYYGGAVHGGVHKNDLIVNNNGYYALIYNAYLYSCTVADNTAGSEHYGLIEDGFTYNCIFWGNLTEGVPHARDDASDPKFVGGGDYHLRAGSPAIDDGLADWQTEDYVGLTDLDGNARVQGAKIDRGCYEAANGQGLEGVLVLASAEGNGTVSPAHSFVNVGTTVTITADTSTWHRDVAAWYTNGVPAAGVALPAGLRPLEYVESTGDQYVDTGIAAISGTTAFDYVFENLQTGTTWKGLVGARNGTTSYGSQAYNVLVRAGEVRLDTVGQSTRVSTTGTNTLSYTAAATVFNGTSYPNAGKTALGVPLMLFTFGTSADGDHYAPSAQRLFSCSISEGGALVRDFVPVADANGVAGLFDRVTETVFYSATATPLVAGPEKSSAGNTLTFTATGEQIDVVAQFATLDWFVNGTTGSDTANDGRTAATAFKTIQHAIDAAAPGEQITVAAGVYAPIDASRANVAIIGAGRDTTIIDGGDTTRCANLGERGFSYLSGFTLRNGRHMNVTTDPADGDGGGGAKGGLLYDCMITNCTSTFGGGAFHSEIHRSIIADCSAYDGGGVIMGECFNCLFECNYATQGGAASMASLWGCTVVKNRAVDYAAVYFSSAYSCVFKGNASANGHTAYALQAHGECCFEEEMDDYNVSFTDDPLFVDFENGDYRLREDSPCIDQGWGDVLEDEYDVRGVGFPRQIDALGGEEIADMGCYEGGVPLSQVPTPATPAATRTVNVSGGGAALQNAINSASDGDTLLVAAGTYSAIDASGKVLDIRSVAGPATTIIRGTASTRAVTFSPSMTRPNSSISGFTIEGGTSTDLRYGGGGVFGGNVSNCVIRGNSAYAGGGVAQAYVTHSIISNNTASVSGGGACAAWLDTCLVVRNAANVNLAGFDTSAYGGGVPSANDNESGGGGIAFSAANFCTITRNTSTTYAGGGMFVVLDNTYIAGNTADQGGQYRQNGDLFPVYPSYVCATSPTFHDADGFVNATEDDSLVDPDNGDYTLKATSLCVEGADTDDEARRTATDLAGNPRWRGAAPDIGCYEAAGVLPAAVQGVGAATGLSAIEGGEGVALWWDVTRGAEWYTIHRGTTSNDYASATLLATVQTPTVEFEDFTAAQGVDYYYWVVAHSSEAGDGPVGDSVEGYWVPELVITTPYLPNGLTRELYSTNLAATGGMPPYTWTVETPAWLSVSGSTLSGMPRKAGDTTVTVSVEDADGQVDIRSWTLTIENNPAPFGPATPYAGEAYSGNYTISNLEELRLFEETLRHPDGFDFEGATFTLTADIDCGGRAFTPTNGTCSYFNGTFDGQGHVISNYVNHGYSTGSLLGDAGYGAVVRDVTLVGDIRLTTLYDRWGTTALSTNNGAAAFAEYVRAGPGLDAPPGLTMVNCHFVGTVTNDQTVAEGVAAGGLVAYVDKSGGFDASPVGTVNLRMTNCTVRATVNGREGVGGLVAAGYGIEATDCHATGGVYRASNIGGLGGYIRRSSFTDCSFDGEVDAIPASKPAEGGGGLVGAARGVTLRRCAARARVCWEYPTLHDDDHTFTACGGAIGVSWDDTACYDCSFEGSIQSKRGFFGGFVGWADSAEVFSNCHVRATYAPDGFSTRDATGGFAGVVSSDGARFVDCSAESLGGGTMINSGFFASQQPVVQNVSGIPYTVGSNSFLRCSAKNMNAYTAGFCASAWNCAFRECSVLGGGARSGFVGNAGDPPSGHLYAQNSLYEDCSVSGTQAGIGFVNSANSDGQDGCTNVFRRCRASGAFNNGFGTLGKGSTAEDCAVVGLSAGSFRAGFAGTISTGATVRRCVGAVMPLPSETFGAGFADSIGYDSVVEDCYSVYAPTAAAIYDRQEGGFVRSTTLGISSSSATSSGLDKIARCFTLGAIPATGCSYIGSFCGGTPEYPYGATYDVRFEDCYRPAESPVGDFSKQDHAGVAAFTRAEFANATAATMPNYDFQNVWHAPRGDASSPYLKASTDENGNFWFYAAAVAGTGRILVNGAEPAEAYPAGAVLTVSAVSDGAPFTGWVGEGFADPTAQTTTYTVRNVSVIGATFGTPIYTVADFTNLLSSASTTSETTGSYVLMNDLDFTGVVESNQYATSVSVYDFQGKFFGQGHTISGLCTTNGDFSTTFALFQSVSSGAEIRDLTVVSSNVTNNNNTLSLAGLAATVGSGVTISNCHAVVDWQGVYPASYENNALNSCMYYGLARTVSGSDIHIVDCTVEGRLAGGTAACGFVGEASLTGGEIARCAVFADVSTITNRTNGSAAGFAGSITLEGGAVVRECLSAGVVDAERDAFGFAGTIDFRDAASSFRDCYSTAEVVSHHPDYYNSYGIAQSISGYYEGNATIENVWFGGAVRGGRENRSFARSVSYANLVNCRSVTVADAPASGTAGVTALSPAAARQSASWTGFDFANVWDMIDGSTTPYFAWSLTTNGCFRVIADEEPGTTIVCGDAAPGTNAVVSASADNPDWFFASWKGVPAYTNAAVNPSAFLADNHRTVRCAWGKAITTRAELAAIASDPTGIYVLGADIDLASAPWTPLCQSEYTPFTGTLYGNGHTISNMTVDTNGGGYAGLFGYVSGNVSGVTLATPVVSGGGHTGAFAGCVNAGASVSRCAVIGGRVTASGNYSGVFAGSVEGAAAVSECFAVGTVASSESYVGGFSGYVGQADTSVSDCYAVADATGSENVGSFTGHAETGSCSITRCYASGTASGSSNAGGFAGMLSDSPVLADCFAQTPAAAVTGVTVLDAAGMRSTNNFAAFQAAGVWSQTDGVTQPYFAWGLVDGKFILSGDAATVIGLGAYAPGAQAPISANTQGRFFIAWTGGATYSNANESATTVLLDNFRSVAYLAGVSISTRAEFADIANNPSGIYGLAADIDLSGSPWTPIGDYYTPFTGKLYGRGHVISNLTVDTDGDSYNGLFGCLGAGATISDLTLVNPVVKGGYCTGALAGYANGATVTRCSAIGAKVEASGERAGGLVGFVENGSSFSQCYALGDVSSTSGYVGGFVGYVEDSPTFSECFACGSVTATGDNVGGFVGELYDTPSLTDCYALVDAKGGSYVGGFVGQIYYYDGAVTRCYSAGSASGSSEIGGFAGRQYRGSPSFTDCFRPADGLPDLGTSSTDLTGVAALDAAGFLDADNFASFHDTGKWTQVDGKTQPYFAWGLVDGKMTLSGTVSGAADGCAVSGTGAYAPGTAVSISAVGTASSLFLAWTGNAPYADPNAAATTVVMDNFRVVNASFGGLVSTREQLAAIANDPAGVYGLGADIDLGGAPWTPICQNSSTPFSGTLYGRGHVISNLTVTGSSSCSGLFGYLSGEVSGVTLVNPVVSGGDHTGAFAGNVTGATVNRCAVIGGTVTASGNYSGVFAGSVENGAAVSECFAVGTIASTSSYVGGFSGYVGQNNTAVSDCYAVADATGSQRVGSFTGHAETSSCSITRCYAAGTASGSSDAGGFSGYVSSSPVIADCFAQTPSAAMTGVTVLDAAGMRAASNFAAFRAAGCWSQIDGKTQPYFAWGLVDGGFLLSGDAATITGLGAHAPGTQAPISVDPTGGIFLGWTGGATYADASSASTTVLADNYRTVSASLGTLITTRAELEAISSDPAGYYGLGADIDLSGAPWTPLGSSSQPFTGTLYGRGYKITGLAFDNTSSGDSNGSRAGLFRYVRDATIDGIHLEGVSINGYERCGALAGEVQGATTIRNCSAQGSVSGNYNYIGLLAGYISGSGVLFEGCATTGSVSAVQSDAGGFAGIVYGGAATFIDCHANAAVSSAGSGTSRGGFISALYSGSGSSSFTRCTAEGSVSASGNSYVGGFISYVGRPGTFTDCSANVRVSGGQKTGGFAGRICDNANGSTFLRCTAGGDVSATSDSAGGFVGSSEKNATFTECRALGAVSSTSEKAGGFVGNVTTANAFLRCMAAGSVTATKNAGGFVGYNGGSGTTATECFAIGDVTATTTDSDANAGGFLGYSYYGMACTDCYAIGSAKGLRAVGGFAGQVYDSGNVFTRCYAAGALDCTGTYAGAFVGYPRQYGAVTDCRAQFAGVHAAGTGTAGDSAAFAGVTELDSAGMHARSNFAPYHALDPQVWAQIDGATHPYFTWSLSDGRMSLLGATAGASGGAVAGAGWHEPGVTVTIRAVESDTAVFVGWIGTTPYANPAAATTTVVLDNFRTVTARFSKLVSTAGQLADLRNDLASDVALGADIDLSSLEGGWTPIGDNSAPFTGTFHGKGHTITGLRVNAGTGYTGLFGVVRDATLTDIHLEGVSVNGSRSYTGALVGDVQGRTTIRDCSAEGVVANAGTYTGLLVGRVSGAGTAFENCAATGAVVSASAETGGLVGGVTATASFADCAASVDVSGTGGNNKGGFVGSVNAADTLFTNCVAVGSANGAGTVGGFVGSSSGSSVQYVDCEAHGPVSGTGDNTGGFAGSSSSGPRFAGCGAFGAVSSSSRYVGGFVGNGSNSAFWRCLAVGSATGSQYVGGFLGYNYSGNLTFAECFALGDVTATTTGSDAFAGGFVGSVSTSTSFTDSYCLGTVKGLRKVGGFAGTLNNTGLAFTRCYAAGGLDCSGTYAGAFVGYLQSAATFGDCAVLCAGDLHAVGSSTAGTSDQNASIAEYDAAGMKTAANFQTWLAIDDADGSVWSQADNLSQPYLAWSAPDGKLVVYPSIAGSGHGEIAGAWTGHNPGSLAQVTAVPQDSFFVDWIGSTPYTDRMAATTTIALDNHRVAAARLGRLIYTADELDAVRNNLGGIYGLGADIDLAGRDWTPIGSESSRFTGQFYGYGHAIENMLATNNPSVYGRGLFGGANGATFDGITVSGTVVGTGYYVGGLVGTASATLINGCTSVVSVTTGRYGGGLIGRVEDGTVIRGCSAAGTVKSTANYGYSGGFAGSGDGSFEIRDSVSSAEVTAVASYVGGFIGYVTGSGASVISGCRADGYAGGNGDVGGFVGYVSAPLTISDCVARGDVRSSGSNYGGFVGRLNHASATIANCWCSGAVWGTGSTIGAFIGNKASGTIQNCSIYAYGAGPRPFSGSGSASGGELTAFQIDQLSADWPAVKQHVDGATPISTAEELFAVTNNLAGIYVLKNDIDLGGATISPIGNYTTAFSGEFYGKNHKIKNFVVNNADRYAGLFGKIAGGRVSGVVAEGTVVGAPTVSGYSDVGVGGFAGKIQSRSLVDGCSFQGAVTNKTAYNAGGFVGMTDDEPVILRSCVLDATVANPSGQSDTGGFIGYHRGGYIMDCYAIADVSGRNYLGGFTGDGGSGKITTSYCSSTVTTTGSNYIGAFSGSASSGNVTKTYYDSGKTSLLAVNNAAYTGITPLTSSEMLHAANFPVFDFDRTWLIDEGATTPYLQTFIVVKRGFDVWTEQAGYPEGTEPGDVVDGIPAGIRYVYNIPADATSLYALPGEEFFHVVMDAYGNPCVKFRAKRDLYEGVVVTETILATDDLTDWTHLIPMRYNALDNTWKPTDGIYRDQMFFRWKIDLERSDD